MLGGATSSDERSFRLILANKALAATSAGLQGIALPWLILELTGSPLHLGVAFALRTAPDVLLAPVVGTAIDSLPRKWIFVAAEGLRGLTLLALPAFALSGGLAIWHVFVAMVGLSVFTSLAYNTRRTILPSIVDESALDRANSRLQSVDAVLSLAFVGVGGGLLATIGTASALVTAVGGSLGAGLVLLPLGLPEREGTDVPERSSFLEVISSGQLGARVFSAATELLESVRERGREGVGTIRRNRLLLELLALGIAVN
ncbi:MAG: MFS transporter, partial [Halodesulfurarchaeum sp.]